MTRVLQTYAAYAKSMRRIRRKLGVCDAYAALATHTFCMRRIRRIRRIRGVCESLRRMRRMRNSLRRMRRMRKVCVAYAAYASGVCAAYAPVFEGCAQKVAEHEDFLRAGLKKWMNSMIRSKSGRLPEARKSEKRSTEVRRALFINCIYLSFN